MASRHRQPKPTRSAVLHEPKPERQTQHRRVRRSVNQDLHVTSLGLDPEGVVFEEPRHTHGYLEPGERTQAAPAKRRVRHWKQKFWKRRTGARQQRARLANGFE